MEAIGRMHGKFVIFTTESKRIDYAPISKPRFGVVRVKQSHLAEEWNGELKVSK